MINKESLNVTKSQIDIDRELILLQAKEYAEQQMRLNKPKNKFAVYIIISCIFMLLIFLVYLGAIYYRNAQFTKLGL